MCKEYLVSFAFNVCRCAHVHLWAGPRRLMDMLDKISYCKVFAVSLV